MIVSQTEHNADRNGQQLGYEQTGDCTAEGYLFEFYGEDHNQKPDAQSRNEAEVVLFRFRIDSQLRQLLHFHGEEAYIKQARRHAHDQPHNYRAEFRIESPSEKQGRQ